jgi:hypothetical protein
MGAGDVETVWSSRLPQLAAEAEVEAMRARRAKRVFIHTS